jgi:hypothetical protein
LLPQWPNTKVSKFIFFDEFNLILLNYLILAGFQHHVALTGFKWIGNLADELRAQGKTVILSWEESIGLLDFYFKLIFHSFSPLRIHTWQHQR